MYQQRFKSTPRRNRRQYSQLDARVGSASSKSSSPGHPRSSSCYVDVCAVVLDYETGHWYGVRRAVDTALKRGLHVVSN